MRPIMLGIALIITACAPPPQASAPTAAPTTEAVPVTAATASPAPPTPGPTAQPTLQEIAVAVAAEPFPVVPSLMLRRAAVVSADEDSARIGVQRYLESLDRYRESGDTTGLALQGTFRDAVVAGLRSSATPGVRRKFALESLRMEQLYRKPWGTRALAHVAVTIVDRAVDANAPDQRESGLLRMTGDKLHVSDAWDYTVGRWYNGGEKLDPVPFTREVAQAIAFHLRTESWVPGAPAETYFGGTGSTPYADARAAYVRGIDRSLTPSRTFADVTAMVERYDTFAEVRDGLATVLVAGTLVTADADGYVRRAPFERRVVVLFGNWTPEVVDEELSAGVWRSGGDRALAEIDVNRA